MNTFKNGFLSVAMLALLSLGSTSFANTPPTITGPHGHAVEVSGKITLMRAQMKGLELGNKDNYLDAEVLVTLEGHEGKVFGFRFHDDNPEAIAMENLLREAYFRGVPVTLSHKMEPNKTHLTVIWVQLGDYGSK